MTQLLAIGFSKAIRGKGLSKNRPTCENAVVWKLDAPGYMGSCHYMKSFCNLICLEQ